VNWMKIGDTEISEPPDDLDDFGRWTDEELLPAGLEMAPGATKMGFNGRPITMMEMLAVSLAMRYSPERLAERWIEDFESFIGQAIKHERTI